MLFALIACTGSPVAAEEPVPADQAPAAQAPKSAPGDPCALVDATRAASIVGASALKPQPVETRKRRTLCAWTFAAGRIDFQVSQAPEKNREGWAGRMVKAKLEQGMVPEPGLGASAVYGADSSQIFWQTDDHTLYHVSIGGDRPGYKAPHEQLRALADSIQSKL